MSDTLQPYLFDVTNSKTSSLATSSKDSNPLSSQDDSDPMPPLSSPSSASTMSSPSSLVDITTNNSGNRNCPTVSPTCLPLENPEIDQTQQYIETASSTTDICDDGSLVTSSDRMDPQQSRCDYCGSMDSTNWNAISTEVNRCCQDRYTDQCTKMIDDTICSDAKARKRPRLDQDTQQQQNLDDIHSITTTETQSLPTVSSISTSVSSSQLTQTSSISTSVLTTSISTNTQSTLPDGLDISKGKLDTDHITTTTTSSSSSAKTSRACLECNANDPPLWRNGPDGKKTLCNACGIRYSKFLRGVLSQWRKLPSDGPKKKHAKKRRSEEAASSSATIVATTTSANIASATSLVNKKSTVSESRSKKCDTLRERKTYLKAGIHSGGGDFKRTGPFKFSLPLHQGALLLNTEREFELPLDIVEDYESGRLFGWTDYSTSKKPPRYIRILHNSFIERKTRKEEHQAVCHCLPPESGVGCGEDCLNRMMFFECDPSTCPCGDMCSNQRFRKRQFVKGLKVYLTEGRGWGIMTKEFIRRGTLITEYRGEIISDKTCQQRIRTVYKHQKNFYFLDYHKGEVIDACTKGSEARFINHGCDPNCHIEKWSRNGEFHLGVFASKDIPIDSELFYDYNFSLFDTEAIGQECRCGSSMCRGFLGKRTHPRKTVSC